MYIDLFNFAMMNRMNETFSRGRWGIAMSLTGREKNRWHVIQVLILGFASGMH